MIRSEILVAIAGAAVASTAVAGGPQLRVFYFEDWETVDLSDALDEGVSSEIDTNNDGTPDFATDQDGDGEADVWAGADAFAGLGWTVDTPNVPGFPSQLNLGVEEWREWALTNSNWWAFDVDNQRRGEFATGFAGGSTVAVADPDEWDDISAPFTDPDTGITTQESPENLAIWGSTLVSPEIALPAGVGEIAVDFFLSWRDEDNQEALVTAQFTDGAGNNVGGEVILFTASSDSAAPNFFDDTGDTENNSFAILAGDPTLAGVFPNGDTLTVPAGAAAVELNFGLLNSGNDWWLAVDSIALFAESAGGPIIAPGSFVVQGQSLYETIQPTFNLTRAIEADSYTLEVADSPDFSNVVATVNAAPASPDDLSIPVQLPSGSVNTGRFYARATATNGVGTTTSLNTFEFVVLNTVIGDINGNGVLDPFDQADLAAPFGTLDIADVVAFLQAFGAGQASNP